MQIEKRADILSIICSFHWSYIWIIIKVLLMRVRVADLFHAPDHRASSGGLSFCHSAFTAMNYGSSSAGSFVSVSLLRHHRCIFVSLGFFPLIWSPGMTVNFNCLDFNLLLFNYLQICLNLFDLKKNVHIYPLIISINIVLVNDSEFYIKTISKVYRIKSVILQKVVWLF